MGIFSKKKREDSNSLFHVTITTGIIEDKIKQKTKGELPLADIGGYISPSGGYLNYAQCKVIGTNPSTGRKNTRQYEGKDEDDVIRAALSDGLVGPFEIIPLPFREPTERQLSYAFDLGAVIPEGACLEDVSAIISRIVDDDESAPLSSLSIYADKCGAHFSRLVGKEAFWSVLFYELPERDLSAFYAYSVYCKESNQSPVDILGSPHYDAFYQFADMVDDYFLEAIKKRSPDDLAYPHGGTKIYKVALDYLKKNGLIKDITVPSPSKDIKVQEKNCDNHDGSQESLDKKQALKERNANIKKELDLARKELEQSRKELRQAKSDAKMQIAKSKEDVLSAVADSKENLKSPASPVLSVFLIVLGIFLLLAGVLLTFAISWACILFVIAGIVFIVRGSARRKR